MLPMNNHISQFVTMLVADSDCLIKSYLSKTSLSRKWLF